MTNEELNKVDKQNPNNNKEQNEQNSEDIFGTLRGVPVPQRNENLDETVEIAIENLPAKKSEKKMNSNRYHLIREIGSGGFGTVYKAFDSSLRREVAIKTVHFDQEYSHSIEYFEKEARMLAQCNHPNIVQVYDVGKDGENPYIVMEFINGLNICEYIKFQREMKDPEQIQKTICSYMVDFVDAVNYMHKRDIYHQDIKPDNMLVSLINNCAKLVDFGLADKPRNEKTDSFYGSYGYIPPEKFAGEGTGRQHDIYALGAVFYEILTGRPLHIGNKAEEILFSVIHGNVEFFAEDMVDKKLQEICKKCLMKNPEERYVDLADVYNDLMDYSGSIDNVNDYPYLSLVMGTKKLVFPLHHDKNFIGRTFSNNIVIPDLSISRSQAIIEKGKDIRLKNLSEVNTIKVGNVELGYEQEIELTGYEKIVICGYIFHYVAPSEGNNHVGFNLKTRATTVSRGVSPLSKMEAQQLGITHEQINDSMWESTVQNMKSDFLGTQKQKLIPVDELDDIKNSIAEMKKMLLKFEEKFQ